MTPTARKILAVGLGYSLIASQNPLIYHDDNLTPPRSSKPRVGVKSQITPKQKKARNKSKSARKARRK